MLRWRWHDRLQDVHLKSLDCATQAINGFASYIADAELLPWFNCILKKDASVNVVFMVSEHAF